MLLTTWQRVLASWANALGLTATSINFVEDLSPDFFNKLCVRINRKKEVKSLAGAAEAIQDAYPMLVFGDQMDNNSIMLLGTAYFLWTALYKMDQDLCQNLCDLPLPDQIHIKNTLEAFVNLKPDRITRDMIYSTLHGITESSGLESPSGSDILRSRFSGGTPPRRSLGSGTPTSSGARKWNLLKQQYHTTLSQKNTLQEELDTALEMISGLENSVRELKEVNAHLVKKQKKRTSTKEPLEPPPEPQQLDKSCENCHRLASDLTILKENNAADQAELAMLRETLSDMGNKLVDLESERKEMSEELFKNAEQIAVMEKDRAALQALLQDISSQKKHLEEYIDEMKESSHNTLDVSPINLASEVIDLQLHELRTELDSKSSQLKTILEEKLALDKSIAEKETIIADFVMKIKSLNSEKVDMAGELESNSRKMAAVEEELGQCKKQLEKLNLELKSREEKISSLECQNTQVNATLADLRCRFVEIAREAERWALTAGDTITENEKLQRDLSEAKSRISAVEGQLADKKEQLTSAKAEISKLTSDMDGLTSTMSENNKRIHQLAAQLSDKNEEVETLYQQLVESAAEIKKLTGALSDKENEVAEFAVLWQGQIEDLQNEVKVAKEQAAELSMELSNKDRDISSFKAEVEDLKKLIHDADLQARGKISELKATILEQGSEIESLQNTILEHGEVKIALEAQLAECKKTMEETLIVLESTKLEVENQAKQLDDAKLHSSELSNIILERNQVISVLKARADDLAACNEDLMKSEEKTRLKIEELESTLEKRVEEVASLSSELSRLQEERNCLQEEIAKKEQSINDLTLELHNAHEQLQARLLDIDNLNAESAELSGKLQQMEALQVSSAQKIDALEADLAERMTAIEALQTQLHDADKRNEAALEKIGDLEATTLKQESETGLLKNTISEHFQVKIALESQLAETKKTMNETLESLEFKKMELVDGAKQLAELTNMIAAKDQELFNLETKSAELASTNRNLVESEGKVRLKAERLETMLEKRVEELASLNSELSRHREERNCLQEEVVTNQQSIQDLTLKLHDAEQQLQARLLDIANLNAESAELSSKLLQMEALQVANTQKIDALEAELAERRTGVEALVTQLHDADMRAEAALEKIDQFEATALEHKSEICALNNTISELNHVKLVLESDVAESKKAMEETMAWFESQKSELMDQAKQLEVAQHQTVELTKMISEKNLELSTLQTTSAELASSNQNLVESEEKVRLKAEGLETMLEKRVEELASLKSELSCHQQETARLQKEVFEKQQSIDDLALKLHHAEEQLQARSIDVANSNAERAELSRKLLEVEALLEQGTRKIDVQEAKVKEKCVEIAALQQQLSDAEIQAKATLETLAGINATVSKQEGEMVSLQNTISELAKAKITLESQLCESEKTLNEQCMALVAKNSFTDKLVQDLDKQRISMEELMFQKIAEKDRELSIYKAKSDELASQNETLANIEQKLRSTVLTLTSQVQDRTAELANLSREFDVQVKENSRLAEEIANGQHSIDEMSAKLCDLELQLQAKSRDVSHLSARVTELSGDLSQMKAHKLANIQTIDDLNVELEARKSKIQALEKRVEELEEEKCSLGRMDNLESLKNQVGSLESEAGGLKVQLDTKDLALASMKTESESRNSELSKLRNDYDVAKLEHEVRTQLLNEALLQNQQEVAALNKRLHDISLEMDVKDETVMVMDQIVKEHKASLRAAENSIKEMEATISSLKADLGAEIAETAALKSEKTRLEATCAASLEKLRRLADQLEKSESTAERLTEDKRDLEKKLVLKATDIGRYEAELVIMRQAMASQESVNAQLQKEIDKMAALKDGKIARLEAEKIAFAENAAKIKLEIESINAKFHSRYEDKLARLKSTIKQAYNEKMEELIRAHANQIDSMKEEMSREKSKRHSLEAKIRQMSDELLIAQEEKRSLLTGGNTFKQPYPHGLSNPAYASPPLLRAQSLDRIPSANRGLDNLGADYSFNDSLNSRRSSTSSNRSAQLPKGIGKIFPAAEEDGEVFDDRCLADLKSGICNVGTSGVDRVSILKQRNSMCPPHLKSSYPVETQFLRPETYREDDIKISKENKLPAETRRTTIAVTPSKLKALFRRKEH